MNKKQPLLSICIPTYNRSSFLEQCLQSILISIKEYQNKIELIVSDNCSTDNTQEILDKYKKIAPFLQVFKNEKNYGVNYNFFKLTDEYASGKFCWLLGDDDFLHLNSIKFIITVIEKYENISYIRLGTNTQFQRLKNYDNSFTPESELKIQLDTFNKIIGSDTNFLGTFISSSIFLRNNFKFFNKKIFGNSWDNYYSTFPHAYIHSITLKNKLSVYIQNKIITESTHHKEWKDKDALMILSYMPNLYNHFLSLGYKKDELIISKKTLIEWGIQIIISIRNNFKIKNIISLKFGFLSQFILDKDFYKLFFFIGWNLTIKFAKKFIKPNYKKTD